MEKAWFELDPEQEARAQRLLHDSVVVDTLHSRLVNPEPHPVDGVPYLDRLLSAGYTAVNVTLAAHAQYGGFEAALQQMYQYYNLFWAEPKRTLQVLSVSDIERAKQEGKVGVIFGFQNAGAPIGEYMWRWSIFHRLGLRIAQLCYSEGNIYGDGCAETRNAGLSSYGKQAIGEMNRLGIAVDLSHAGERTSLDAIAASAAPVIFSHSNPRAIGPSFRNISDEQIRGCAETGGVIGITPHSELCHKQHGVRPTIVDYLDHIEYAIDLVGPDHVGIGTDVYESYTKVSWEAQTKRTYKSVWMYETMLSEGFSRIHHLQDVVRGLVQRGHADDVIKKYLGGNWTRVLGGIWDQPIGVA